MKEKYSKTVLRLSRYRSVLKRLKLNECERIFSSDLATAIGVKSSQVRKDFSLFGITGKKKAGYKKNDVLFRLDEILGEEKKMQVVMLGGGGISNVLLQYPSLNESALEISAFFNDNEGSKTISEDEGSGYPLSYFSEYVKKNNIKTVILSSFEQSEDELFKLFSESNIECVLNFSSITLKPAYGIKLRNMNLLHEIEVMLNAMNFDENKN